MTLTEQIARLRKLVADEDRMRRLYLSWRNPATGKAQGIAVCHDTDAREWQRLYSEIEDRSSMAIYLLPAILDHLEQVEKERDAIADALWCAEAQWGDDYFWKKWGLSKTLTKELKDRLMNQATNEEGKR